MTTEENTHWETPDTRVLFMYIIADPDLLLFTIREFGQYDEHFTDECEAGLKEFFGSMIDKLVITERINLDRVHWPQLIGRFMDGYNTQVNDYKHFKKNTPAREILAGDDLDSQDYYNTGI